MNGFDFHFLLADAKLYEEGFGGGKVDIWHDPFCFFEALGYTPNGVVLELLKVQQEYCSFVLLAESIDFEKLIFPFFKRVLDDLMIFGLVCRYGIQFVHVVKVHLNHFAKPVTVNFQERVSGVNGKVQGVDDFLLSVVSHDYHLQNVCFWLFYDFVV